MHTNEDVIFKYSWQPYAVVFISNICIMILELVAGRMIAPHLGVSLYTWTSIIGVVLAGISIGNYIGGILADRWASKKLLGYLIFIAGILCITILGGNLLGNTINETGWHIIIRILILTSLMFLFPCLVLGTISPVVAKLAVRDLAKTGSTVGKIYAAGTFGSILGTFLTGFFLISWFGTYAIVLGVTSILLILGIAILFAGKWHLVIPPILIIAVGWYLAAGRGLFKGPCTRESNYYCIRVEQKVEGGDTIQVLILDQLVHSFTNLDDPARFIYSYEFAYAEATEYMAGKHSPLRAAFIGGGGYTFPRYMDIYYPDSQLDVAEIDPAVTEIAFQFFDISPQTTIHTINDDARLFFKDQAEENAYSLVFGDAFNGLSVPYHLTTLEFNELVQRALKPDGLYLVHIVDFPDGQFAISFIYTLRQTFQYVYRVPFEEFADTSVRGSAVIIASDSPISVGDFKNIDGGDGVHTIAENLSTGSDLDALLASNHYVLITDDYAPVEQLIAPAIE